MKNIEIFITVEEGRQIFHALSELPFKMVFELIGKINNQTNAQAINTASSQGTIQFSLTELDLEIISEALSKQPYEYVHTIMKKIVNLETS